MESAIPKASASAHLSVKKGDGLGTNSAFYEDECMANGTIRAVRERRAGGEGEGCRYRSLIKNF